MTLNLFQPILPLALLTVALLLTGCSTVTIAPGGQKTAHTEPHYEAQKPSYLLGLMGDNRVDVSAICSPYSVRQMQAQRTIHNALAAAFSAGIYTPHTVKVWCDTPEEN
ncbi:Bor family protein [Reinekea blandensis]|uniref:Uncharacterized protein n=1 Tax=Reinekea blandensis MED297 TaxID=314283 RepID=A4BA33_9GAMM|nr:Bor family protein [Reinekea blandensis]EAR10789.1 hypothetical protein MED297_09776 [Reinekea sp. MED297] [Reinekea blandensis MED297]